MKFLLTLRGRHLVSSGEASTVYRFRKSLAQVAILVACLCCRSVHLVVRPNQCMARTWLGVVQFKYFAGAVSFSNSLVIDWMAVKNADVLVDLEKLHASRGHKATSAIIHLLFNQCIAWLCLFKTRIELLLDTPSASIVEACSFNRVVLFLTRGWRVLKLANWRFNFVHGRLNVWLLMQKVGVTELINDLRLSLSQVVDLKRD